MMVTTSGWSLVLNERRQFAANRVSLALFGLILCIWLLYRAWRGPSALTLRDGLVILCAATLLLLARFIYVRTVASRLEERTRERDALAAVLVVAQRPIASADPNALAFALAEDIRDVTTADGVALLVWDSHGERIITAFAGLGPETIRMLCEQTTSSPFSWNHATQMLDANDPSRNSIDALGMPAALREQYLALGMERFALARIPLDEASLGMLALWSRRDAPAIDRLDDRALVLIARQTGLAIQNARLLEAERRHSHDQATLLAISRVISGATDLRQALDEVTQASLGFDGVDGTDIELVTDDGAHTEIVALARRAPWSAHVRTGQFFPLAEWPSTVRVLTTGDSLITNADAPELGQIERDAYRAEQILSIALIPIVVNGAAIGMVSFLNRQRTRFPSETPRIGAEVATQIAQLIERIRLQDALRVQATVDSLTGVLTRRAILAEMDRCLLEMQVHGRGFATVMVDFDDFKQINDALGHAAGDAVLRAMTRRFGEIVADQGAIGRYGGDEFVIVLPGGDAATAHALVAHLHEATGASAEPDCPAPRFSTGLALAPDDGDTIEALLRTADAEMYAAKRQAVSRKP